MSKKSHNGRSLAGFKYIVETLEVYDLTMGN